MPRVLVAPIEGAQSARSVREDTAELASYFLSDKNNAQSPSFLARARSQSFTHGRDPSTLDLEADDFESTASRPSEVILEESEPPSPEEDAGDDQQLPFEGPSIIASMLRRSPPEDRYLDVPDDQLVQEGALEFDTDEEELPKSSVSGRRFLLDRDRDHIEHHHETAPLLPMRSRESRRSYGTNHSERSAVDAESQKGPRKRRWFQGFQNRDDHAQGKLTSFVTAVRHPSEWDRETLWQNIVVAPVSCLPAVVVGLLLNILDALSYGTCSGARWQSGRQHEPN